MAAGQVHAPMILALDNSLIIDQKSLKDRVRFFSIKARNYFFQNFSNPIGSSIWLRFSNCAEVSHAQNILYDQQWATYSLGLAEKGSENDDTPKRNFAL